jgi:membrane-bound metal-dependent hydrolase YbcI (DUF457 family)
MLIGHYAVGLASKRFAPRVPLAVLIAAPVFLDLLWPLALLTGLESVKIDRSYSAVVPLDLHDYPYTHSLALGLAWSALFALAWLVHARDRRATIVLFFTAFSHWLLDWVTHPPDMPLWPGSAQHVGLDLWRSVPATLAIELAMFAIGIVLYLRATVPRDRTGNTALAGYALLLVAIYLATVLGPPPPNPTAVALMALGQWPLLLWARWIDRHRKDVITALPTPVARRARSGRSSDGTRG